MRAVALSKVSAPLLTIIYLGLSLTGSCAYLDAQASPIAEWVDISSVPGERAGWEARIAETYVPDANEIGIPAYPESRLFYGMHHPDDSTGLSRILLVSKASPMSVLAWYRERISDYCAQKIKNTSPIEVIFSEKCEVGISKTRQSVMLAREYQNVVIKGISVEMRRAYGNFNSIIEIVYRSHLNRSAE